MSPPRSRRLRADPPSAGRPDPEPSARRAARARAALLGMTLLAVGCGGEPAPPSVPERVVWELAPGAAPKGRAVQALDLTDAVERARWRVDDADVVPSDPLAPLLVSRPGEATFTLARPGPFDLGGVDEVAVRTAFRGRGSLVLEWLAEGEVLHASEPQVLERGAARTLTFAVPFVGPVDALQLRVDGQGRNQRLDLEGVTLSGPSPAGRLPDPSIGPDLVRIGRDGALDARRGVGVTAERAVTTRLAAPAGSRLRFSYGVPEGLGAPGVMARLALTIDGAGDGDAGELWSAPLVPDAAGAVAWTQASVELPAGAGPDPRLTFRVSDPRVAAAVADGSVVTPPGGPPPRVLLITSDTHRGDHLGTAGRGVEIDTPVLDALAARGVQFTDAFSSTNVTNPSHTALMTGTHPRDTGVLRNDVRLAEGAPTLAETFAQAGFRTFAAVSVFHLGHDVSGLGQGFDRMSWPPELRRDATGTIDVLLGWLEDAPDDPLFVWLHVFDAHAPYEPPEAFDRLYYDKQKDPYDPALPDPGMPEGLPRRLGRVRDPEFLRAQYKAEITYLDSELERVFEAVGDDAVIAFLADHGEALGLHHGIYWHHAGLYPQTVHIPMILDWPGAPEGVRSDAKVTHLDVGRTLLDLGGVPQAEFPGRNLAPLAEGSTRREPRFLLATAGMTAAVQADDLLLILHLVEHHPKFALEGFERHQVELYDLAADPTADVDLVEQRPQDAARLRGRLIAWLESGAPSWTTDAGLGEEELAQLRALGYLDAGKVTQDNTWEPDDCAWCRRFEPGGG